MDMSPQEVTTLGTLFGLLACVFLFAGPTGLFVFRKHLKEARGGMRVFKITLQCLTAISAPFTLFFSIVALFALFAAGHDLWELVKAAW
jgi:hypothetical protein